MMRRTEQSTGRRGFTLVELIAVITVIAILAALVLAAVGKARKSAQRGAAVRLLESIATAADEFKNDFGWYPPLLINRTDAGANEAALPNGAPMHVVPEAKYRFTPGSGSSVDAYRAAMANARYHSDVSLTAYLLGSGDLNGDERVIYDDPGSTFSEPNFDDGADGPAIRHPGPADKSWGGGADRRLQVPVLDGKYPNSDIDRWRAEVAPPRGREFGPYLDPGLVSDSLVLRRDGMYVLEDQFGNPIRYYRDYPTRDETDPDRPLDISVVPSELRSAASIEAQLNENLSEAAEIDRALFGAQFVLLSAGEEADITVTPSMITAGFGEWSEPPGMYTGWVSDMRYDGYDDLGAVSVSDPGGFLPPFGEFVVDDGGSLQHIQSAWGDILDFEAAPFVGAPSVKGDFEDQIKTNVRVVR